MAKNNNFDYNTIVIGSGAGATMAASILASAGQSVAIVEESILGGSFANVDDIPLAAIMTGAKLYAATKRASAIGLRTTTLGFSWPELKAWKRRAVAHSGTSNNTAYFAAHHIQVISGHAHFVSPNEISVNHSHFSAANFIIATGATWDLPAIPGLATINPEMPPTVLEMPRLPRSIIVLGGTIMSLELSQLLALLGVEVYLVTSNRTVIPGIDQSVNDFYIRTLSQQQNFNVFSNTAVLSVEHDGMGVKSLLSRGGEQQYLRASHILAASEQTPNVDIGLVNAAINANDRGITVDQHLRTSNRHIYALGDVLGVASDTYTTLAQAKIIAHNILQRSSVAINPVGMPSVVHTSPEFASIVPTVSAAQLRLAHTATTYFDAIAATRVNNGETGMVSLTCDKSGTLIGGSIIAPTASDMIAELSLAIRQGITVRQIATTPHTFLSWSEAIRATATKLT